MKLRYRLIIVLVALLISFIGFNLIASPLASQMHKGHGSGFSVVAKVVDVRVADCC
jgi:hypothetical protein